VTEHWIPAPHCLQGSGLKNRNGMSRQSLLLTGAMPTTEFFLLHKALKHHLAFYSSEVCEWNFIFVFK